MDEMINGQIEKWFQEAIIEVNEDKIRGLQYKLLALYDILCLKLEEKKKWPKRICVEGVQQSIHVTAYQNGEIHLIEAGDEDIMIFLTWENLDEIYKLRPRAGVREVEHSDRRIAVEERRKP